MSQASNNITLGERVICAAASGHSTWMQELLGSDGDGAGSQPAERPEVQRPPATDPAPVGRSTPASFEERYHVPRSQVWEGSGGRQQGNVHLHVLGEMKTFKAASGRTLVRGDGRALCGKRGWYEREPYDGERRCPRCEDLAVRYGIQWPEAEAGAH
jgi:hypothetical protein